MVLSARCVHFGAEWDLGQSLCSPSYLASGGQLGSVLQFLESRPSPPVHPKWGFLHAFMLRRWKEWLLGSPPFPHLPFFSSYSVFDLSHYTAKCRLSLISFFTQSGRAVSATSISSGNDGYLKNVLSQGTDPRRKKNGSSQESFFSYFFFETGFPHATPRNQFSYGSSFHLQMASTAFKLIFLFV